MIATIWEDVCRFHANTVPFYIRDLSICKFWICRVDHGTNLQIPKDDSVCVCDCVCIYSHSQYRMHMEGGVQYQQGRKAGDR